MSENGRMPLPSEEENCHLVEVTEEDVAKVITSIPKLDTLILIKHMLKKHSFQVSLHFEKLTFSVINLFDFALCRIPFCTEEKPIDRARRKSLHKNCTSVSPAGLIPHQVGSKIGNCL